MEELNTMMLTTGEEVKKQGDNIEVMVENEEETDQIVKEINQELQVAKNLKSSRTSKYLIFLLFILAVAVLISILAYLGYI